MPNPHPTVLNPMTWPAVNVSGSPLDQEVQRVGNLDVNGQLRVSGGALGVGNMGLIPQNVWFVDDENGNDSNDGMCWNNAFKTIQRAVNQARYGASSGALEYVLKAHHKFIFVRPGHYNLTSYISMSGYGMHLIGLGAVPGKDYGVSLNYDGALAATGVIAFSGSHNSIQGIHISTDAAIPGIYIAGGDNNLIEGNVIEGNGTTSTAGIYAPNMKGSWIRNNVIARCIKGIDVPGGVDCYFLFGGIVGNQIWSDIATAKGIHIASVVSLLTHGSRISHNFIALPGASAKGIDIDHNGCIMVSENNIVMTGGGVGIETAGDGILHNHVSVSSSMVGEAGATAKFVNDNTQG